MSAVVSTPPTAKFLQAWRQCFGEAPPLGHILRRDFFDHWTRFHALPKSKRYADTSDESAIALSRASTLATECFGEKARVWVIAGYPTDLAPRDSDLAVRMSMTRAMTWVNKNEEPEDRSEVTFFVLSYEWQPRSLDRLFGEIANDQERAVLFSEDTQTVLAPYDGGFDIVSLRPGKTDDLEAKYRAWMSGRPDRL